MSTILPRSSPTLTGEDMLDLQPIPSWPKELAPHAYNVPSSARAKVWAVPQTTWKAMWCSYFLLLVDLTLIETNLCDESIWNEYLVRVVLINGISDTELAIAIVAPCINLDGKTWGVLSVFISCHLYYLNLYLSIIRNRERWRLATRNTDNLTVPNDSRHSSWRWLIGSRAAANLSRGILTPSIDIAVRCQNHCMMASTCHLNNLFSS